MHALVHDVRRDAAASFCLLHIPTQALPPPQQCSAAKLRISTTTVGLMESFTHLPHPKLQLAYARLCTYRSSATAFNRPQVEPMNMASFREFQLKILNLYTYGKNVVKLAVDNNLTSTAGISNPIIFSDVKFVR